MICDINDLPVYYEIHGEGTPVLMIHGYYPDHRLMKAPLEPLFTGEAGWQRIYFDLPGMGQTPARPWINSSDDMLAVVEAFAARVIPEGKFLVFGESYGGYLARGLVHRLAARIDGLCLICPSIIPEAAKRDVPPHRALVIDESLFANLPPDEAAEFREIAVIQDRRCLDRFLGEIMPALRMADVPFLENLRRNFSFSFAVDSLPAPFDRPALILTGRQDSSTGYRDAWKVLENYPRASFAVLDLCGHNLQFEQEMLFNALVKEFLARVRL